jgi:glycine/D-amino acid oxidase-like deaminating enzyme
MGTGRLNLPTHTFVISIESSPERGWTVKTSRGTILAKKGIHATNLYVVSLLPQYDQNIIPCKEIYCRIDSPKGVSATVPLLTNSYINRIEDKTLSYLIPRTDGSIVVGGAARKFI